MTAAELLQRLRSLAFVRGVSCAVVNRRRCIVVDMPEETSEEGFTYEEDTVDDIIPRTHRWRSSTWAPHLTVPGSNSDDVDGGIDAIEAELRREAETPQRNDTLTAPPLRRFTAADLRAAISSDYDIGDVTPLRSSLTSPQDGRYRVEIRLGEERGYQPVEPGALPQGVSVYLLDPNGIVREWHGINDNLVADLDDWQPAQQPTQRSTIDINFRRGLPSPAQVAAHTSGLWESLTAFNPPGGPVADAERRQPRTRWHLLSGRGVDGLRHVWRREADGNELIISPRRQEWSTQSFRPIADDGTPVPWSTVEAATPPTAPSTTPSTTPSAPTPASPVADIADIARRLADIVGACVTISSLKHDGGANIVIGAMTLSAWPFSEANGAPKACTLAEQPAPLPRGVLVNLTNGHGVVVPLRGVEEPAPSERRQVDANEITRRLRIYSTDYQVVGRMEDGKLVVKNVGAVVHAIISRKIPAGVEYIVVDGDGMPIQTSQGTDATISLDVTAVPLYQPPRYFAEDGDTAWSKQVPRWLTQAVQKVGAVSAHWQIVNSDGAKRLTFRFPWGVNAEAKQREIYDNSTISGKTTKIFVAVKTECMPAPRVPVALIQQIRTGRVVGFADLGTDGRDWTNAPSWSDKPLLNTVVAVIRDIVAASPQLTDEQAAERANCYAEIVEEARRSGTEVSEIAKRYCDKWLNRFALLEIDDHKASLPPAQLKLSKKPLTLDVIAKTRDVLSSRSGTQEDAKKAAGIDDLEIYFLSKWARGLSDGETLAWWQSFIQLVKADGRICKSDAVDVAIFDAVALRTKPAPTIDPDAAADPAAVITTWQQRQHERREQERKWRQRQVVEEVVAAEPTRWDLLELDGAVPVPMSASTPTPMSRPATVSSAPPAYRSPAPRHIDAPTPPPCPHYIDATMLPRETQVAVVLGAALEAAGRRQYDN